MLRVRRALSPLALDHIKDFLLEDQDESKEFLLSVYAQRLKNRDPQFFMIVIIDEDGKKPQVVGHLIAYDMPGTDFIWVHEAVYNPKIGPEKGKEVTLRSKQAVIDWAVSLNKRAIRMMTKRDPEAWTRKWGLVPVATTMEYRFDTIVSDQITQEIKENSNGINRPLSSIGTGTRAEGHNQPNLEAPVKSEIEPNGETGIRETGRLELLPRATDREVSSGDESTGERSEDSGPLRDVSDFHERSIAESERAKGV